MCFEQKGKTGRKMVKIVVVYPFHLFIYFLSVCLPCLFFSLVSLMLLTFTSFSFILVCAFLTLFLSVSLPLSLCLCLSVCVSLCVSLCQSLSLSLFFYYSLSTNSKVPYGFFCASNALMHPPETHITTPCRPTSISTHS